MRQPPCHIKGEKMDRADIAIIGTGPAGVSAAITSTVRNKKILFFGNKNLTAKLTKAHEILNYPGFPEISGEELAGKFQNHLESMSIDIIDKKINAVYPMGKYFGLQAAEDIFEASTVILATGVVFGKPFVGEQEFLGRGVSYCATCDAGLYRGKIVAVIGYNEESEREADFLADIVSKVYYIPMKNKEPKLNSSITVIDEKPMEITGGMKAEILKTDKNEYNVDCVFILRDAISASQLINGVEMNGSHVAVKADMSTNIPGLFACGDIAGKPYQYIKAAGQGNVAALSAVEYLSTLNN